MRRIYDPKGVAATFAIPHKGKPWTFKRLGKTFAYSRLSGDPADGAVSCGRAWADLLRSTSRPRLSYLLVGSTLQVVLHPGHAKWRFEVSDCQ